MKIWKYILPIILSGTIALTSCRNDRIEELELLLEQDSIKYEESKKKIEKDSIKYSEILLANSELKENYNKKDSLSESYLKQVEQEKKRSSKYKRDKNDLTSKLKELEKEKEELNKKIEGYNSLDKEYSSIKKKYNSIQKQYNELLNSIDEDWEVINKKGLFYNWKSIKPILKDYDGKCVYFGDNNPEDMKAYVMFKGDNSPTKLDISSQGSKIASFLLPKPRDEIGHFTIWAEDKDGNISKEKTFYYDKGRISKEKIIPLF